ncbi:MAG: hypothetical protein WCC12_04355 [Anaerolineales bacterium]
MQIAKGVIGAILLFLGLELNFFFAGAMAALIGLRLTPLLPIQWPWWSDYVFMAVLAVIAAGITLIHERAGFFFSGFLAGGYFLVEYFAPGLLTLPLLPFLVGGVLGSLVIGLFTDWGLIIVTCLIGAYYVTDLFVLSPTAEMLVTSGLFIVGAVTQAILWYILKKE